MGRRGRESRPGALGIAAAIILTIAAGRAAEATTDLDQFGFGARPIAMGGAFTALASDFTATYYNPAGLTSSRSTASGLGFSYADHNLEFSSESGTFDEDVERVEDLSAFTLGVSSTFGKPGTFLSRIGLGSGLFLPTRQIVGAEGETPPGEPDFFFYGNRYSKISILPAAAFKILDDDFGGQFLSIGAGAILLADLDGKFKFNVGSSPSSSVEVEQELGYDAAPTVGIHYWPVWWLSFGLAYRGELSLKADIDTIIDLDNDPNNAPDFVLKLETVQLFVPDQVQGGFAVDPVEWLTVAVDVTWKRWSSFKDPFITIDPGVTQVDPDFDDTFTPRLGVEAEVLDGFTARFGYYYQPTPVPEQDGETTIVDNDKHVVSFGAGYAYWTTEEELARDEGGEIVATDRDVNPFTIDVFLQWHSFVDQDFDKEDPADPAVGVGFDSGGSILNLGFTATFKF